MSKIEIIEGFFFKLKNNDIFYVKGVVHPPNRLVSYPKYISNENGDRIDKYGNRYRKIQTLRDEYEYITSRYGAYIRYDEFFCRDIVAVPLNEIAHLFDPIAKVHELLSSEPVEPVLRDAVDMVLDIVNSTNVKEIGISGSILIDLYKNDSDIDVVVYGVSSGLKVYSYLKEVVGKDPRYRRYKGDNILQLYMRRSLETPIPLHQLIYQESRRVLEGYFNGREYFIRLVKLPHEEPIYGSYRCVKLGKATMKLKVIDAGEAIFTPCRYKVEVVKHLDGVRAEVNEVYTLRGRFAEIAHEGEEIIVHGTVERIEKINGDVYHRLYLGDEKDYIFVVIH